MLISDWSSDLCSSDLLGVGLQGLGVAEVAYQNAVQYAQDRRQGRALTGPAEPTEKADPLFVNPDVRRMLMDAKATIEGLRALCMWAALQVDLEQGAASEEERQAAADMVGQLNPDRKSTRLHTKQ